MRRRQLFIKQSYPHLWGWLVKSITVGEEEAAFDGDEQDEEMT